MKKALLAKRIALARPCCERAQSIAYTRSLNLATGAVLDDRPPRMEGHEGAVATDFRQHTHSPHHPPWIDAPSNEEASYRTQRLEGGAFSERPPREKAEERAGRRGSEAAGLVHGLVRLQKEFVYRLCGTNLLQPSTAHGRPKVGLHRGPQGAFKRVKQNCGLSRIWIILIHHPASGGPGAFVALG
jgi:hypothetical protein